MTSPFKFLDAYAKEDKAIYFGRDQDADQLDLLLSTTDIALVYGPSGTGKTSLIMCGLGNRIRDSDWLPVFVRRRHDVNQSLREEIAKLAKKPVADDAPLTKAVRSLYLDHLRPVYLIFDQFEELFILGTPEEEAAFVEGIASLLQADVGCKVLISLREEYIARLYAFEEAIPELFQTRLRVEPMTPAGVEKVITSTCAQLNIALESGPATASKIVANLNEAGRGVQLAYLQVYLDRLYRAADTPGAGGQIVFTDALVERIGQLDDVLADFLESQIAAIQHSLAQNLQNLDPEAVQHILEMFTTLEGTKHPMTRQELVAGKPELEPVLDEVLAALREARILRDAEGLYELAHDALAGRIAELRSAASKNLLRLQKIVQDRMGAYDQTKTYLSRQELQLLRPYRQQLSLDDDGQAFVRRSNRAIVRTVVWRVAGYSSAVVLTIVALFVLVTFASDPKDPDTAMDAARLYASTEPRVAIQKLTPAINAHPDNRTLLYLRAALYWRVGRDDLASADYAKVRATGGGSSAVLNQLCWFMATRGLDLPQAMADCNTALLVSDAKDSRAFVLLREGGHDQEALGAYQAAVKLRPNSPTSLYGLAVAYMRVNQPGQATHYAAMAEGLDPKIAQRFRSWGVTLAGASASSSPTTRVDPMPIHD